jgi:hypothetical protein
MQEFLRNRNKIISNNDALVTLLKEEYLNELLRNKKDKDPKKLNLENLGFADITVWFYKKNCPQSLEEAKTIWENLPQNQLQRHNLDEFLEAYSKELLDKHQKFSIHHSKYRKIENILNRTHALVQSLNDIFSELNLNPENNNHESNSEDLEILSDIISFSIYIKSVEGHDLSSVFQRSDFLGHHIEIGYKDDLVLTETESTQGNQIDFQEKKLEFNTSIKDGSVFIHLYEDYQGEEEPVKKLVAQRNLDLFTNVNQKFLNDLLAFDQDVARIDEIKYDIYHLKKFLDETNKNSTLEDGNKENYAKLEMSIHIDGFSRCEDLLFYFRQLKRRKAYLEERIKQIKLKSAGYKQKVMLLAQPFKNVISFNEKCITINEIPENQNSSKISCNLF